jgi:endonuclease-3
VLISTILSHRVRDETTERVSKDLFRKYPNVLALARADLGDIQKTIRPAGLALAKARALKGVARRIVDRFGGIVPSDLGSLVELPSVGRKTANAVIVFGFGGRAIPVDVHIQRVAGRILGEEFATPLEAETRLMSVAPPKAWTRINPILVQHGQNLCRYDAPRCGECPIADICEFPRTREG